MASVKFPNAQVIVQSLANDKQLSNQIKMKEQFQDTNFFNKLASTFAGKDASSSVRARQQTIGQVMRDANAFPGHFDTNLSAIQEVTDALGRVPLVREK